MSVDVWSSSSAGAMAAHVVHSLCSICSNPMDGKSLSCGHIFHVSCIDGWIRDNGTCPNCRSHSSSSTKVLIDMTIECSVCLDNILAYTPLPCGHFFHEDCLEKETVEAKICPTCSEPMFNEEPDEACLCPICQNAIVCEERILPCGHIFHEVCVLESTSESKLCPMCSEPFIDEEEKCLCPICQEAIVTEDEILPCGHIFHEFCVQSIQNKLCPTCSEPFPDLCKICKGAVVDDPKSLPCGHIFHKECILNEASETKICPVCSEPFPDEEVVVNEDNNCSESPDAIEGASIQSSPKKHDVCLLCYKGIDITDKSLPCGHRYHNNCDNAVQCPACLNDLGTKMSKDVCVFCNFKIVPGGISLRCNHSFHENCASQWFAKNKTCPECCVPVEYQAKTDICAVCSLETSVGSTSLSCGHVFHENCLNPWYHRQGICSECLVSFEAESKVMESTLLRENETVSENVSSDPTVETGDPCCSLSLDATRPDLTAFSSGTDTSIPSTDNLESPPQETTHQSENIPEEPFETSAPVPQPTPNLQPDSQEGNSQLNDTSVETEQPNETHQNACQTMSEPPVNTNQSICKICSNSIDSNVITLPCGNVYHKDCLATMLGV